MGTIAAPSVRVFGFPVTVRPGFLVFIVLVVAVYGTPFGLWFAGAVAGFTLVHELGHAFAARATGARAEISLDFLAGYASFVPTRELKPWERAAISFAGPGIQFALGLAILLALGIDPLSRDSITGSHASVAIWWAGPLMGLFNLVPILPLDGGNIAQAGLETIAPRSARRVMAWFSLVVTLTAMVVFIAVLPELRFIGLFLAFPLMFQLQMVQGERGRGPASHAAHAEAEAEAWQRHDTSHMRHGQVASPWYRAMAAIHDGRPADASEIIAADLADPSPPDWWPPEAAPRPALAVVVAALPRPLPHGRDYSEHVMTMVLLWVGAFREAADYAAESYRTTPSPVPAMAVARAAAALDDREVAMGWLRAAAAHHSNVALLADALDHAPEFERLRADPDFVALRHALAHP